MLKLWRWLLVSRLDWCRHPGISDRCAYTIAHLDGAIVYLPLRPLAFFADRETADFVARLSTDRASRREPVPPLLERVGFFAPDPAPPSAISPSSRFEPTTCVLLLTTVCNLRCVYCYASPQAQGEQLDVELGKRAIDIVCDNARKLAQSSFTVGFHGGGEPTMALPALRALVAHARAKPLPCSISLASNGFWDQQRRRDVLDLGFSSVSLSLDGVAQVQDRQRPSLAGQGTFATVMETIREIERRGISYGIRASVTEQSVRQLAESIDYLCRNTQCSTIQVEPAFAHGRALQSATYVSDHSGFVRGFLDAYDIACYYGRHLYYSGARPWAVTSRFCMAVDQALIVSSNGELSPCYEVFGRGHALANDFLFGRIEADKPLAVDYPIRQRLLSRVEERRSRCRDCFCYYTCAGDCIAKAFVPGEQGHLEFGRRCEVNRAISKELLIRHVEQSGGVWRGGRKKAEVDCS
jgi:uncharacterized protein